MPDKVIDASALIALLYGEPEAESVARWIGEGAMIAPTLLPFEMANACLMKLRRRPGERAELLAAFDLFERLDVRMLGVDTGEVIALAEQTGLTACDASYLWLARQLGVELVTLDTSLAKAFAARPKR
jgi:predicted nucleic acid-binding protein